MTRVADWNEKHKKHLQREAKRDTANDPAVRDVNDLPGIRTIRSEVQQEYSQIKARLISRQGETARQVLRYARLVEQVELNQARLAETEVKIRKNEQLLQAGGLAPNDVKLIRYTLDELQNAAETHRVQIDEWRLVIGDLERHIRNAINSAFGGAEIFRRNGEAMMNVYFAAFMDAHWDRDRILGNLQPDPNNPIRFVIDPPDWANIDWKVLFEI